METMTGSSQVLKNEILAAARRQAAAVLAAAEAEAGKIISGAESRAREMMAQRSGAAQAAAARRREALLASVPAEAGRLRGARVEAELAAVKTEAAALLSGEAGNREIIVKQAAAAISRMEGKSFVVKMAAGAEPAFREGLAEEISGAAGKGPLELAFEEDASGSGGALVLDKEGRQYWDNRFPARLDRLWPGLRLEVMAAAGFGPRGGEGEK